MKLIKHFVATNVMPDKVLPSRVQLFKVGENQSSKGTVIYDPAMAPTILSNQLMADGRDLYPIDLEHERGASQGWFSLTVDDTGVYADNIQWTDKGTQALSSREFRYYSPTFYTDENNNVIQIDSFALTNSPALYNLTPLVASKELPSTEETKELENMSTVTDKVEEFKAALEAADPMSDPSAPVDEKDQMIADLQAQVQSLQSQLADALAQLDAINASAVEAEKEVVLSSLELSSDEEKVFFSKMDLEALKEYSKIVANKKVAVKEIVEPIVVEAKEFTSAKKPTPSVVVATKQTAIMPSLAQIQARAQQFANQRNVVKK